MIERISYAISFVKAFSCQKAQHTDGVSAHSKKEQRVPQGRIKTFSSTSTTRCATQANEDSV